MLELYQLSSFGAFHTVLALVAVVAGIAALVRHGQIGTDTRPGLAYVLLTVATSITGMFIFRHGGFGPPHALALLTLLVLAVSWITQGRGKPGSLPRYVSVLGYSLTLFFHLIPGLTETGTRLPLADPVFSGPEDPTLKMLVGAGFLVYLAGAARQAWGIRKRA